MLVSSVNLWWIVADCVKQLMLIKNTDELVMDCSRLVETLEVDKEYRFNDKKLDDESRNNEWENLKYPDTSSVIITTKKIKEGNAELEKWSFKLIDGIKNSSSTWEDCQNLVLDFYKTKNTQIIVSFEENAKECSHSDDLGVKLEYNSHAFLRILESTNPQSKIKSLDVIFYASIGLGVLAIILLALIFLFIVKLRKQSNVQVIETNDIYGEHLDYEEEKAAKVTDTNDYYNC